jgi:hypothetical protein
VSGDDKGVHFALAFKLKELAWKSSFSIHKSVVSLQLP